MAWSRGRSWPGSQPGAHRKQTLPRGSAQYRRFSLHAVPFCAQEAVAPGLYSPFIRLSSRLQLHAHARHAWAFSIDRFGWERSDIEKKCWKEILWSLSYFAKKL